MRTTVVLDDGLVAEAREVLGGTLRSMIERGLREAIRARLRGELREALGTGELAVTITEDDLRQMRRERHLDLSEDGADPEAIFPSPSEADTAGVAKPERSAR